MEYFLQKKMRKKLKKKLKKEKQFNLRITSQKNDLIKYMMITNSKIKAKEENYQAHKKIIENYQEIKQENNNRNIMRHKIKFNQIKDKENYKREKCFEKLKNNKVKIEKKNNSFEIIQSTKRELELQSKIDNVEFKKKYGKMSVYTNQ